MTPQPLGTRRTFDEFSLLLARGRCPWLIAAGCALLLGCSPMPNKQPQPTDVVPPQSVSAPPVTERLSETSSAPRGISAQREVPPPAHDEEIFFPPRSGQWLPTELDKLETMAERLKADMTLQVTLTGLTESLGSRTYSITIASQRVDNIKAYLRRKGVRLSQIISYPMGYSSRISCQNGPCKPGGNARVLVNYTNR